jgi:hypothetical protein
MADIIKRTERHNCHEEITASELDGLYYGSVVECSCGKQYIKRDDQREGAYWADHKAD